MNGAQIVDVSNRNEREGAKLSRKEKERERERKNERRKVGN